MLLVAAAPAQDVLSVPVGTDGRLAPPLGARLEQVGVIETLAGTGDVGDSGDGGPASEARFSFPRSVAVDSTGNVYVVDTRSHRIRRIDADGVVSTFAGTGEDGDEGDGGPASEAGLCFPAGAVADAAGNLYIADTWNHRIRKVDTEGVITTLAGTGRRGDGGDGGPASAARLAYPTGVAADAAGNLYIADSWNHRVRKVDADGVITTFVGTGRRGGGGDGGPASAARLANPSAVAVDAAGSLYIADTWNHRVRKVDADGVITTLAGGGYRSDIGDGGPATEAGLAYPSGVAAATTGSVYVATFVPESGNRRIRRIEATGTISGFAGVGGAGFGGDGGPAGLAQLADPLGVAVDLAGNVFIADTRNARIRVVRPGLQLRVPLGSSREHVALVVTEGGALTLGGSPVVDGREVTAVNGNSYALTADPARVVAATYLAESQRVRLPAGGVTLTRDEDGTWRIAGNAVEHGYRHPHGGKEYVLEFVDGTWGLAEYVIETVAGATDAAADGVSATAAFFRSPIDVAVDRNGNLYVSDHRGHRIHKIDPFGIVTTLAGTGDWGFSGDGGPATRAMLNHPFAIVADDLGNVYVAEQEGRRIRRIDRSGVITTFAGTGEGEFSGDGGPAIEAPMHRPLGLEVGPGGIVYVSTGDRIRTIGASGVITTFAGTGERRSTGDGGPAVKAELADPHGIAVDAAGNVYVAERDGHRVRKINGSGVISTFAGTGDRGHSGDGGPATLARLEQPRDVAIDSAGNVYVAEDDGERVRKIDAAGVITTYAGAGDDGDGSLAAEAHVRPFGIATDTLGNLYLAEPYSGRVRRIDASGTINTIAGSRESAMDLGRLGDPRAIATSASGDIFFGDSGSVWKLSGAGEVTRLAGSGVEDHPYLHVEDLAADTLGNLYVAENGRNLVRKVDTVGNFTTFAGTGEPGSSGDGGIATEARLDSAAGVAVDSIGNVYVAEGRGHRVRKIDRGGVITTFAGTGNLGSSGDGGLATEAELDSPLAVAVDRAGTVFIADRGGRLVRKVDSSGVITPFADLDIRISQGAFATDASGRVYAGGNRQILRIDANGEVSFIAGTGEDGYGGDGGPALSARFSVFGIGVDPAGDVWFADRVSRRIRVLRFQHR